MSRKKEMTISISGEELNKSEIIYNNIVKRMEEMDIIQKYSTLVLIKQIKK